MFAKVQVTVDHLKRISYQQALRSGRLSLDGPPQLTTAFTTWIRPSPYADIVPHGRRSGCARTDVKPGSAAPGWRLPR